VSVIGLGYIGLPTAAILACSGVRVFGCDIKASTVDAVNQGILPFAEPDLAEHLRQAVDTGMLTASRDLSDAEAFIIAVPTPLISATKKADLTFVRDAARAIAAKAQAGSLVILESTSPPGTTERIGQWITELRPDLRGDDGAPHLLLAHCPERVLPGRIMVELVSNDRVVGGTTPEAAARGKELYKVFCDGQILTTDARTAEMAKLVENSYRDVNIAFANELSLVCDALGVDVWELITLANHHPRVNILQPGPGVGGHCIAVDPHFIVEADPEHTRLIATAREVNDAKPNWVVQQVRAAVAGKSAPVIAALGLAFKPDVDDLRESPAIAVVDKLAAALPSARIRTVEPHVHTLPSALAAYPHITLTTLDEAIKGADAIVLLVNHKAFATPPTIPPTTPIIDTRGAWGGGRVAAGS